MAAQANLTSSHFSCSFKQTIGQSPNQFLMTYCIEPAKKMLNNLNNLMVELAFFVAFATRLISAACSKRLRV
jgi:AraC-like DNA-binding protein